MPPCTREPTSGVMQLVARNGELSARYVIVLAGYPIVDTLFAMYRRGVVRLRPLMEPDALHLHSLVYRRIAIPYQRARSGADPTPAITPGTCAAPTPASPRLWPCGAACLVMAIVLSDDTRALLACLAVHALYYTHRYRALVRFGRRQVRQVVRR